MDVEFLYHHRITSIDFSGRTVLQGVISLADGSEVVEEFGVLTDAPRYYDPL
jgi:hypothetical protein